MQPTTHHITWSPSCRVWGTNTWLRRRSSYKLALSSVHLSGHTLQQDHLKKGFKNISAPSRQHKCPSRKTWRHKSNHLFTVDSIMCNRAVADSYRFYCTTVKNKRTLYEARTEIGDIRGQKLQTAVVWPADRAVCCVSVWVFLTDRLYSPECRQCNLICWKIQKVKVITENVSFVKMYENKGKK